MPPGKRSARNKRVVAEQMRQSELRRLDAQAKATRAPSTPPRETGQTQKQEEGATEFRASFNGDP